MSKSRRKLTPEQKAAKRQRRKEFMTIFVNGKQKRVRRPPTVDGMPLDEFISQLVDVWCDRRELQLLSYVLPAWTGNNGLTDGWRQLYDDLKHAYAMCTDLPPEERDRLKQTYVAIDVALRKR
jgi:hypothetical protein